MSPALRQFTWKSSENISVLPPSVQKIDYEIRSLVRQCRMPSPWIELDYQTEPSFFKALAAYGHEHDLVLIQPDGFEHLAGLGIRSIRSIYLDGKPVDTGYLHHLRFHPEIRGGSYLLRGYKEFRRIFNDKPLPVTLTSIVADNNHARQMLEGRRADGAMPVYQEVSRYLTAMIPLRGPGTRWPVKIRTSSGQQYNSRILNSENINALVNLFAEAGKAYDGIPVVTPAELANNESVLFPGLKISDFIGIFNGDSLVAAAGIWNQRNYRQIVLTHLNAGMGLLRNVWNSGRFLWGPCPVPSTGSAVNFILIDPWVIKPGLEKKVMPHLLSLCCAEARRGGADFAAIGAAEKIPVISSFKTVFFLPYWSIIYQVYWPETGSYNFADRNLYLSNLGAL